jgi:hypothetical protein
MTERELIAAPVRAVAAEDWDVAVELVRRLMMPAI